MLAVLRRPELVEPLARIHAGDEQPVAFVSRAVIDSGACDEARRRARHHTEAAVEALRGLEPTRARDLLESAAWHLAARAV